MLDDKVELIQALGNAQAELENPERNETAKVKTKSGSYSYDYTTLDALLEHVKPVLAEHDLTLTQTLTNSDGGYPAIVTILAHDSGESISTCLELPMGDIDGEPDPQDLGAAVTYIRRYSITSLLGIAAETDGDAARASNSNGGGSDNEDEDGDGSSTENQLDFLNDLCREKVIERDGEKVNGDDLVDFVVENAEGCEELEDLSFDQASSAIEWLKGK